MKTASLAMNSPIQLDISTPLAARIAQTTTAASLADLPTEVIDKTKLCLLDLIGCAFESRDMPWSRQAVGLIQAIEPGASVIGAPHAATYGDAAFANAVMGHGLVREDMHSGSISHLGIVVLPALLALSQYRRISGREFIIAAVVGYEVGGRIGRAIMDAQIAKIHRPTGITGPVAAAAAGARALGLNLEATTSAIAIGANTALGFNEWAHTGGSEMFFHAGFAARNAVTAARLAEVGAFASPTALDGGAGLFASLGKQSAAARVAMFEDQPEILSVYHKPVPACNFAQTPCQAALRLSGDEKVDFERIAAIKIRVPRAGALYPGCDHRGPFAHILQAKMSIQYNVAAALMLGNVSEKNFTLLKDPSLHRLISMMELIVDNEMTRAYPALQGGEVQITEIDGTTHRKRLDNVVNATAVEVRDRFRISANAVVGAKRAAEIEQLVDSLEHSDDAGKLAELLRAEG